MDADHSVIKKQFQLDYVDDVFIFSCDVPENIG